MVSKTIILSLSLLVSATALAGTEYDNMYVNSSIDDHFPEFLATEITKDFKESINDYNKNRTNPKYFLGQIKDEKLAKIFSENTKSIALPEIKQKADSAYYYIEAGKNRIEFSTALFLTKKYYLNGVEKTVSKEDFVASEKTPFIKKFTYSILSSLIESAVAEEAEGFDSAYKNLDTTKILMASIMALDSSFKERGLMDKIPMMSDVADINLKNLVKKIEYYQSKCEQGLNSEEVMMKTSNSDWSNMGSLDRYSMMTRLRDATDPAYQETLKLVRQVASENNTYSGTRDKKLVELLNVDKKASQCEAMMKPLVDESKTRSNLISAYIDGGNSRDVAFQKHPCTKITKLKMCLSQFYTQASDINDFVRRRGAEAKEAGVNLSGVPNNYPVENASK